jgi:hypothetical protein
MRKDIETIGDYYANFINISVLYSLACITIFDFPKDLVIKGLIILSLIGNLVAIFFVLWRMSIKESSVMNPLL